MLILVVAKGYLMRLLRNEAIALHLTLSRILYCIDRLNPQSIAALRDRLNRQEANLHDLMVIPGRQPKPHSYH